MLAEISVLRMVHHPNVINMYDIFNTEKKLYICTELCTGGELIDVYANGPISEIRAINLVIQVVDGLLYLHNLAVYTYIIYYIHTCI